MHIINVRSVHIQGPAMLPCSCRTCLVDSAVKKVEQHFIMDRLLPILATVVLICFAHDSLQSRDTSSSLVTSTFPYNLLQDLVEV